jgi:hypothetical protein
VTKTEAIVAMLDGKRVSNTFTAQSTYFYYDADAMQFKVNGGSVVDWNAFLNGGYEVYVEPPKEVTRAEAWAALGEGKIVRLEWNGGAGYRKTRLINNVMHIGFAAGKWDPSSKGWHMSGDDDVKFYIVEDV